MPVVIAAELVVMVVHKHECIVEATKNAKVEDRIARKIQLALELLGKTLGHDIYAMSIFGKKRRKCFCTANSKTNNFYLCRHIPDRDRGVRSSDLACPGLHCELADRQQPLSTQHGGCRDGLVCSCQPCQAPVLQARLVAGRVIFN